MWDKSAVIEIAAICFARIIVEQSFNLHFHTRKSDIHRSAASSEILAIATPTYPGDDRVRLDRISNLAA